MFIYVMELYHKYGYNPKNGVIAIVWELNVILTSNQSNIEGVIVNPMLFIPGKLADEIRAKYLLSRYLFSPYPNDNQQTSHYGGGEASLGSSDGIPFRPVRRLGSEFLGKR